MEACRLRDGQRVSA